MTLECLGFLVVLLSHIHIQGSFAMPPYPFDPNSGDSSLLSTHPSETFGANGVFGSEEALYNMLM